MTETTNRLPSNLQIGEKCILNFFEAGKLHDCEIARVLFTESKVRYDVYVQVTTSKDANHTSEYIKIENIDSICVEKVKQP